MMKYTFARHPVFILAGILLLTTLSNAWAQEKPDGWSGNGEADVEEKSLQGQDVTPLTETEQERYDGVARTLVEAINSGNEKKYRALFTDEGWNSSIDWWRDMFSAQISSFGKIEKAWSPRRGIVQVGTLGAGSEWGGARFLVKFEEPTGGVLTILLNDQDKITRTDVFIHRGLGYQDPSEGELIYTLIDR